MPQVPTYDNFQVQPGEIPGARAATPDLPVAPGQQASQMGQALTQAGSGLSKIADTMAMDANRARLNEAMSGAWGQAMDLRDEYSQIKGKDALQRPSGETLYNEYTKKLQDGLQGIRASLGNEAQRAQFDQESEMVLRRFQMESTSYTIEQQKQYEAEQKSGVVNTAQRGIITDPYGDHKIWYASAKSAIADLYKGAPQEFIDEQTQKALGPAVAGVIGKAMDDGNYNYARKYYEEHQGDMGAEEALKMSLAIDQNQNAQTAQKYADGIDWTKTSLDEARSKLPDMFTDPKARAEAERTLDLSFRYHQASQAAQVKQATDRLWDGAIREGNIRPSDRAAALAVGAGDEIARVHDWLDAGVRRAASNDNMPSDREKLLALIKMKVDDPTAFANIDLNKWSNFLSNGDFKMMAEAQARVKAGDEKELAQNKLIGGAITYARNNLKGIGINLNAKPGSPDAEPAMEYMNELHRQLDLAKPKNQDEANRIAARLATNYVLQGSGVGGFFVKQKPGYKISSDSSDQDNKTWVVKTFDSIPAEYRNKILADQFPGVANPTDEQRGAVERIYTRLYENGKL